MTQAESGASEEELLPGQGSSSSVSRKELGRKGKLVIQDTVLTETATVASGLAGS